MIAALQHLRERFRSDRGVTLAELMVTIVILSVVGVVFTTVMVSGLQATRNIEGAARISEDIRLVLATMDREVRSASQVCHPGPGLSSNQLTFETRIGTGETQTISYYLSDPDGDGIAELIKWVDGDERVVVTDVINGWVGDQEGVADIMFTNLGAIEIGGDLQPGSPAEGRVVRVRVWIDTNPADEISPKLETVEMTGRNIWNPNSGCE